MGEEHDSLGARIRAARAFADISSQRALGELIGVGREVVIALEADQREPTVPEMHRIANATSVPVEFLLNGWTGRSNGSRLSERVAALELRVRSAEEDREDLAARLDELDASLERRLETFAAQVLQRRRSQRRQADPPSAADPPTH